MKFQFGFNMNKTVIASLLIALSCTACLQQSPNGGAPSATPAAPSPATEVPPSGPGTSSMGTASGGGANGVDNKTLEVYAVKLETLPEYRKYIAPIFSRMSRGKTDILLGYFNWAVSHKTWLFIPKEFDILSKEQIGVSFSSDQLARNYPKEVHINAKRYNDRTGREKAKLLMHEIVMSARFLMKQTAQAQCAALNQGNEKQCSAPEMLKVAKTKELDDKARESLDNVDHEAVRSLTVFLMEKDQDLSGTNISRVRRNLGFDFPWDQLASDLTLAHLVDAITRSNLAGDRLMLAANEFRGQPLDQPVECYPYVEGNYDEFVNVRLEYLLPESIGPNERSGRTSLQVFKKGRAETRYRMDTTYIWTREDSIEAKGALDPKDESQMVDVLRVLPNLSYYSDYNMAGEILEFYLSRDTTPRLLEIRTIPVRAMKRTATDDNSQPVELVATRDKPTICRVQD